ncbi:MAG: M81 family metallopeptidase [Candidatus Bathyarchaeia archaeon]
MAGLGHETITFWPGLTELEDFERTAYYGDEVVEAARGTNTSIGGFIDVCEAEGVELHPVCNAFGGVTATVSDRVFDHYMGVMRRGFSDAAGDLDGVLLERHGAMVTESLQDTETHIVRGVREAVGCDTPIMAALDLHGNISPALLEEADAVFGYHCSPHTDRAETGRRAARAMLATIRGEIKPTAAMAKPGVVVPSVFSATSVPPGRDILERLKGWERHPGVVDVSALFGFAWSDVHHIGMSMVAITDDDPGLAARIVEDLSNYAWERREALTGGGSLHSVEEGVSLAVDRARGSSKPIIILDHADRTNDTTFVLRELLRQEVSNAALPLFWDPAAAERCAEAGPGAEVELTVGASSGWRDGGPVEIRGRVLKVGPGCYVGTGPMTRGQRIDLGTTAIVEAGGVWLQLVSLRASQFGGALIDEDPFTQFGFDPRDFDIIVTKSKTHFREVYGEIGEEIVIVDAPGQCPADISVFEYRNVPDGIYPITMK